jgi:hypothetical protein
MKQCLREASTETYQLILVPLTIHQAHTGTSLDCYKIPPNSIDKMLTTNVP